MSSKILVAVDFSKIGKAVSRYGCELACLMDAEVTFIHVVPEPDLLFNSYAPTIPIVVDTHIDALKETATKKLAHYVEIGTEGCCPQHKPKQKQFIEVGDPAKVIIDFAEQGAYDLIILGYKGHSAIEELLVGSTANKVTRYAPCSVLVYRPNHGELKK